MFKVLVPAVACVALAAFAARTQSVAPDTSTAPMAWRLAHEGSMAKLTYGAANSDALAVMLTCEPGQGLATVYGEAQPDTPQLIRASTGPAELDPLSGGQAYETHVRLGDPVLTDLTRRGALRLVGDAGPVVLTANAEERRLVGDFLAYCGSAHA